MEEGDEPSTSKQRDSRSEMGRGERSNFVDYQTERVNYREELSPNELEVDLDYDEDIMYQNEPKLDEDYAEYNIKEHVILKTQIERGQRGETSMSQRFGDSFIDNSQIDGCFSRNVDPRSFSNLDRIEEESRGEDGVPVGDPITTDILIGRSGEITEKLHEVHGYLKKSRCVVHVDLDCFYAQVETNRLGLSTDIPLVVSQWGGLLAVNYAARKYGILRMESPQEAMEKCEGLVVVHVPTYAQGDKDFAYNHKPKFSTHKASLAPYREASDKIFKIFHRFSKLVQKGGCDEAFIDLTETVNLRILNDCKMSGNFRTVPLNSKDWAGYGHVIGGFEKPKYNYYPEDSTHPNFDHDVRSKYWRERQLLAGAKLVNEIRAAVLTELRYTCGAGIAHNKHMAKLCSAENKPNQQTTLRESYALDFLEDFPLQKIRFLAGKLGKQVAAHFGKTCGDIWNFKIHDLISVLGTKNANFVYDIVRGVNHKPVRPCKPPLSIMSGKSLMPPCTEVEDLKKWVDVLSCEVLFRLNEVYVHNMWPKNLSVYFGSNGGRKSINKVATFPTYASCTRNPAVVYETALRLMDDGSDLVPCMFVSILASGLETSVELTNRRITEYFPVTRPAPLPRQIVEAEPLPFLEFSPPQPCSSTTHLIDHYLCPSCDKYIHVVNKLEHDDYHFALEIQQQDQQGYRDEVPTTQPTGALLPRASPPVAHSRSGVNRRDLPSYSSSPKELPNRQNSAPTLNVVERDSVQPIYMPPSQATSAYQGRHNLNPFDDSCTLLPNDDLFSSQPSLNQLSSTSDGNPQVQQQLSANLAGEQVMESTEMELPRPSQLALGPTHFNSFQPAGSASTQPTSQSVRLDKASELSRDFEKQLSFDEATECAVKPFPFRLVDYSESDHSTPNLNKSSSNLTSKATQSANPTNRSQPIPQPLVSYISLSTSSEPLLQASSLEGNSDPKLEDLFTHQLLATTNDAPPGEPIIGSQPTKRFYELSDLSTHKLKKCIKTPTIGLAVANKVETTLQHFNNQPKVSFIQRPHPQINPLNQNQLGTYNLLQDLNPTLTYLESNFKKVRYQQLKAWIKTNLDTPIHLPNLSNLGKSDTSDQVTMSVSQLVNVAEFNRLINFAKDKNKAQKVIQRNRKKEQKYKPKEAKEQVGMEQGGKLTHGEPDREPDRERESSNRWWYGK